MQPQIPNFLRVSEKDEERWIISGSLVEQEQVHVYEQKSIHAVNAALAAERPLLLRGEPGVGKSQLAQAVARTLKRALITKVVDSRTTAQDLLWCFDSVARLAQAQMLGVLGCNGTTIDEKKKWLREELAEKLYTFPGPLWWALEWNSAKEQAELVGAPLPPQNDGCDPQNGCVVLIDEIDKADSEVPNALLEVLGDLQFTVPGVGKIGRKEKEKIWIPPLVIITTNEERALPDAFVRRCMVYQLSLPNKEEEFLRLLVERGSRHFGLDSSVLKEAAKQVWTDRQEAKREQLSPPGQAEYLDILRALKALTKHEPKNNQIKSQLARLTEIRDFALKKHPSEDNA
jgi:MoxR-like ATPase